MAEKLPDVHPGDLVKVGDKLYLIDDLAPGNRGGSTLITARRFTDNFEAPKKIDVAQIEIIWRGTVIIARE